MADNLETRTYEQLSVAVDVADGDVIGIQRPGAPVKQIKIETLIGKITGVDFVRETTSLLPTGVEAEEIDPGVLSFVYAEPPPGKSGYYIRTESDVDGEEWAWSNALTGSLLDELQPLIEQVSSDASVSTDAKAAVLAAMASIMDTSNNTIGADFVSTTSQNANISIILGQFPRDDVVKSIRVEVGNAGALKLAVLDRGDDRSFTLSGAVIDIPNATAANAFNDIDVSGLNIAGARGQWLALVSPVTTGAQFRFAALTGWTALSFGGLPAGTQTWTAVATKRFNASFTLGGSKLAVSAPMLSRQLDEQALAFARLSEPVAITSGKAITTNTAQAGDVGVLLSYVAEPCKLTGLTFKTNIAGPVGLIVAKRVEGTVVDYNTVAEYPLFASAPAAVNTWDEDDFGLIEIPGNSYVGFHLFEGGASLAYGNNSTIEGPGNNLLLLSDAPVGQQTWQVIPDRLHYATFSYERKSPAINQARITRAMQRSLAKAVNTFDKAFDAVAPAGWTLTGGWAHSAAGMLAPAGTGDMTKTARLAQISIFHDEENTMRFRFVPQAAGTKMLLGTYRTTGATVVMIDDSTGQFELVKNVASTLWAAIPALVLPVAMPALTPMREYELEIVHHARQLTATIYDWVTGTPIVTDTVGSNDAAVENSAKYLFGSPFIAQIAGQTLYQRVTMTSWRYRPRLMMIGDSKTAMNAGNNHLWKGERWSQRIKNRLGGDAVIMGIEGSKASEIASLLLYEIPAIQPQEIFTWYGQNDTDSGLEIANGFRENYTNLIAYCAANNIRLSVGIPPNVPAGTVLTNTRAYLRGLPNNIRQVRFDLALSQGNDGVTPVADYYALDPIHEGRLGNDRMVDRFLRDRAELFDAAMA